MFIRACDANDNWPSRLHSRCPIPLYHPSPSPVFTYHDVSSFTDTTQCDALLATTYSPLSWLRCALDGRPNRNKFWWHMLLMQEAFFGAALIFSSTDVDYDDNSWLQIFTPVHKSTPDFWGLKNAQNFPTYMGEHTVVLLRHHIINTFLTALLTF